MTTQTITFRPPPIGAAVNKLVVSSYKLMGFVVLVAILLGLGSYIGLSVLYVLHRGWLAPTVVTAADSRVHELVSRRAEQLSRRKMVVVQQEELRARLADAERTARSERAYQDLLRAALGSEAKTRRAELAAFHSLRARLARTGKEIAAANEAYSAYSRQHSQELFDAKLIDHEDLVTSKHRLAEMANTEYSFAEKGVQLQTRIKELGEQLSGLSKTGDALSGRQGAATAANTDMVRLHREFSQSQLSEAHALDLQSALGNSLRVGDEVLAQHDEILKALDAQPLLRAAQSNLSVAFVPYDNLDSVSVGSSVYGCRVLNVLGCSRIGVVSALLSGEVSQKHPHFDRELRGQLVQLQLDDLRSARSIVVHVRRPLLI